MLQYPGEYQPCDASTDKLLFLLPSKYLNWSFLVSPSSELLCFQAISFLFFVSFFGAMGTEELEVFSIIGEKNDKD